MSQTLPDASSPPPSHPLARPVVILLSASLLVLATFGRALFNDLAYDGALLLQRMASGPGGPVSPAIVFNTVAYGSLTGVMSWRPLTVLSYLLLDIRLFGLHPFPCHLLNLLIHALNGWMIFLLIGRASVAGGGLHARWIAAAGAGLFLVHPLVSEAVVCAGFRGDLLALSGLLATLLALLPSDGSAPSPGRIGLAAAAMLAGLMAKESAVAAVVMAPLAIWLFRRDRASALRAGVVLAGVFFLFVVVWRLFQYYDYPREYLGGGGRLLGMANFLVSAVEVYAWKLALPWPLRVDHAFEPVRSLADIRFLRAAGIVTIIFVAWAAVARREPLILFGGLWIAVAFAPLAQIVAVPDPVAERFCYMPMAGAGLLLAGLLRLLARTWPGSVQAVLVSCAAILLLLAVISHRRTWDWRDDVTLNIANWEQAGDRRPVALRSLGALHLGRASGQPPAEAAESRARAAAALEALLQQNPDDSEGLRLLAIHRLMGGQIEEARSLAGRAQAAAPDDPAVQALNQRLSSMADDTP